MKARLLFLVFLVAFLASNVAFGETFNVTNPEEFQNALTIAESNGEDDTINVAAGIYNVTSALHYSSYNGDSGHTLTIQGAGADQTVLDGGGSVQNLYINTDADNNGGDAGGDVTIKGMAFENGDGGNGGGVYVHGSSINITIKQCAFSENSANYAGGGGGAVHANSSSGTVTITNNTFSGNSGHYGAAGGGVYADSYSGTVTITNNTFSENSDGGGGGGAVYADSHSGTVTITNNTFSGNSGHYGAAVHADSTSGTLTITNNTFSGNSANWRGGGVYADSTSGTLTITNNTFSGNSANDHGGGVYADSHSGTLTITNNTFSENSADDGGGVYVSLKYDSAILNIYNNILFDNIANAGGNDGDDLYVSSDGDRNYIGSTVNLYNNDFSGNADFDAGQSEDLYITVLNDLTYHHADNIQKDPQFVDPENGDFHLKSSSPCIDAGTADAPELPDTDFEGDPRIVGSAPDIGADEYYAGQPMPIPDIKVNGSDGPITLDQNDTLTITVSLNNNGITDNADWWLAAQTPFGLYFYTFYGWRPYPVPVHQGPLFYLDSYEVFSRSVSGLQEGIYTLYFGVDTDMDGDITWDSAYYDTVEVTVTD